MIEMAKPQYIQDIELRMIKLELNQKGQRQAQDDMMVEQVDNKRMISQIHVKLMGTDYDKNGGMVSDVNKLKREVKELKIWKIRIVAAGGVITGLVTFLGAFFISQWHHFKDMVK